MDMGDYVDIDQLSTDLRPLPPPAMFGPPWDPNVPTYSGTSNATYIDPNTTGYQTTYVAPPIAPLPGQGQVPSHFHSHTLRDAPSLGAACTSSQTAPAASSQPAQASCPKPTTVPGRYHYSQQYPQEEWDRLQKGYDEAKAKSRKARASQNNPPKKPKPKPPREPKPKPPKEQKPSKPRTNTGKTPKLGLCKRCRDLPVEIHKDCDFDMKRDRGCKNCKIANETCIYRNWEVRPGQEELVVIGLDDGTGGSGGGGGSTGGATVSGSTYGSGYGGVPFDPTHQGFGSRSRQ